MNILSNRDFITLGITFLLAISLGTIPRAYAADPMPGTNCKMATAEDVAAGAIAGRVVCDADRKVFGDSGKAKQELEKMWCGGKAPRCGPHTGSTTQLDPRFAECAAKFLTAIKARYPKVCIESAFRSSPHQACVCNNMSGNGPCATPGKSKHQFGLALDISAGTTVLPIEIHNAARGTGVGFPLREKNDSGHMEPTGGGNCADPNFKPTDSSGPSPSSGISNAFRQALGLDQQPQQSPPPTPQQPLQQAQQPTQYFPSSQPTTNTGTSNAGSQSPVSALSSESQKYLGVTQPDTYKPSISDQLLELAYGTPKTPTTTSTSSIKIVINPNDTGSLSPTSPSATNTSSQPHGTSIGALQPSQTFTSSDLNYEPRVQQTYTPPQTGIFAVLETLKTILLRMLEILRPMGIRNAIQGDIHTEHAE